MGRLWWTDEAGFLRSVKIENGSSTEARIARENGQEWSLADAEEARHEGDEGREESEEGEERHSAEEASR